MSHRLISRSPDLQKLLEDGYEIEIVGGRYLRISSVPYVNSKKEIALGALVSELTLAGEVTTRPSDHVVRFAGEHPCGPDGAELTKIKHQSQREILDRNLVVDHSFSSKPIGGYEDYYHKMTTYIAIISGPAESLDPAVSARTRRVVASDEEDSVFHYSDTASSRAGISMVTRKLDLGKLAIVGLGGTGAYILDQVAKTPVKEIHLFDGDRFLQHNAFRSPGAPSIDELRSIPFKVIYLKDLYSKMHRNIVAHDYYIDESTIDQLREMNFVFLSLDKGRAKRLVVDSLETFGIPFVDVGMGIQLTDDALGGVLRITTSTTRMREHVRAKQRIPFSDGDRNDDYARNIQIADLNALNAALAVVKWKKLFGFYRDLEDEHFSTYTLDGNMLINEDNP